MSHLSFLFVCFFVSSVLFCRLFFRCYPSFSLVGFWQQGKELCRELRNCSPCVPIVRLGSLIVEFACRARPDWRGLDIYICRAPKLPLCCGKGQGVGGGGNFAPVKGRCFIRLWI